MTTTATPHGTIIAQRRRAEAHGHKTLLEKYKRHKSKTCSLSLLPYTGLVLTKGVSIVDMERKEPPAKTNAVNTKTSLPKHHCVIAVGQPADSCSTGCERCGRSS
jgi:hypothetical protein